METTAATGDEDKLAGGACSCVLMTANNVIRRRSGMGELQQHSGTSI
jgi:hypothetical protein